MPNKSSTKVTGISYIVVAFLFGYQLRATYDFNANVPFITEIENTKDILVSFQEVQREQVNTGTYTSQQHPPTQSQIAYPNKASRPKFSKNNPTKCERQWDWPFLDAWTQQAVNIAEHQNITTFQVPRSNAHGTAQGTIRMQVIQRKTDNRMENNPPQRRVVIFVSHLDTMSANAWHRIAVQYMVWIAWQVAQHRLTDAIWSTITNVELAMPCTHLTDIPQGWDDLLFPRSQQTDDDGVTLLETTIWCTNTFSPSMPDDLVQGLQPLFDEKYGNSSSLIDMILIPPNDGLLWDLAWDTTFDCTQSHMFRTFMSQFAPWQLPSTVTTGSNGTAVLPQSAEAQHTSVVCWILRYGNPQRDIKNRDEVHGMLLSIFDTVHLLHITRYHKSPHIKNIMEDCQVVYGVHGAGMVNAMWGTLSSLEKTAVVEVLPNNQPQYFRSLSRLVGHYYEGVVTENRMQDAAYNIDLEKSADALRRALNYVAGV